MAFLHRIPLLLLIMGLSVAVMSLLISYLRYRQLQLMSAEEQDAEEEMSPAALVVYLLSALRKGDVLLCRVQLEHESESLRVRDLLEKATRRDDAHFAVERGIVISMFPCSLDHAQALANRISGVLEKEDVTGSLQIWEPIVETQDLFDWIRKDQTHGGSLQVSVDLASDLPEEPLETHPSVDPETGVLRMDLVSRAIRGKLAECRRLSRSALIVRVAPFQKESEISVLETIARELMAGCREVDLIGRSGERELVLCIEASLEEGEPLANRMSEELSQKGLDVVIGLAGMPDHGSSPNALFEKAGVALLQAEENGGDSARLFHEHMQQPDVEEEKESFGKEVF